MGTQRHRQGPHAKPGRGPKLTLTGRLQGTALGRPVVVELNGKTVSVQVGNLISAWRMRHLASEPLVPLLRLLKTCGFALVITIAGRTSLSLLPKASAPIRYLVPALRNL